MRKLAHWLETYTEAETLDVLRDLAMQFAARCGLHRSTVEKCVRKGDFVSLCSIEPNYAELSIDESRAIRQAQAAFQKLEFLDVGIDKKMAALEKFDEAERICRETNVLFRKWYRGQIQLNPKIEAILHRTQRLIATVLGDMPRLEQLGLRFGPGATSLTKKRDASLKRKLEAGISCSEELLPWAARLLAELPHLTDLHAEVIRIDEDGEEWSTVPVVIHAGTVSFVRKNYKVDRAVETQPVLNGMFQLALGDDIKAKLSRFGVDLSDQARNREGARIGSLTGALATLDLVSASDTIATELVAHLLPVDWFSVLFAARTGKTRVAHRPGELRLEKFSAMGNGYTFPLESLIFWALTRAAVEFENGNVSNISVYGDDIICPAVNVSLVTEVLRVCGFSVNHLKSYAQGPFRESCGADYLSGIDIRPIYQKELLSPAGLFVLHNGLVRRGYFVEAEWVRSLLHPALILEGPDGYGDGHLISESWKGRPYKRNRGYEGTIFDTFARIPKRDIRGLARGEFILPAYAVYQRGEDKLLDFSLVKDFPLCGGSEKLSLVSRLARDGAITCPPLPIPTVESDVPGVSTKGTTFPGTEGYKKIAIYVLGSK